MEVRMSRPASAYFASVARLLADMEVTDAGGAPLAVDAATTNVVTTILRARAADRKVILIGNGGSASIAGHMEMDFCNRVGVRAHVFNDPPVLTALANDHGYETAFERMVRLWAEPGDCLFAISSSGQSANILRGVDAARERSCTVVTFSGFAAGNPLRSRGDHNFYVASSDYGEVEVAHHALGHYLTDHAAESGGPRGTQP
jgi:D-sedoheptulose 7-phosphate isomerase